MNVIYKMRSLKCENARTSISNGLSRIRTSVDSTGNRKKKKTIITTRGSQTIVRVEINSPETKIVRMSILAENTGTPVARTAVVSL